MNFVFSLLNTFSQKINNDNNDKTKILDPLNTIIKLSVLSFKQPKTKLSIYNHNIIFFEPGYLQGPMRTWYGDNKDDLHYLLIPIYLACKNYLTDENKLIFKLAINGLLLLRDTYKLYANTIHTLDLYIYIINNSLKKLKNKQNIDDDYSFINLNDESEKLYNNCTYEWSIDELVIIVNLFNIVSSCLQNGNSSDIYLNYLNSIESILIPIDNKVRDISYININEYNIPKIPSLPQSVSLDPITMSPCLHPMNKFQKNTIIDNINPKK